MNVLQNHAKTMGYVRMKSMDLNVFVLRDILVQDVITVLSVYLLQKLQNYLNTILQPNIYGKGK